MTANDIRFNMQEQLFIKDPVPRLLPGWNGLAEALAAADAGNASALSTPLATGPSDLGIAGLTIAWVHRLARPDDEPTACDSGSRGAADPAGRRVRSGRPRAVQRRWPVRERRGYSFGGWPAAAWTISRYERDAAANEGT